MMTMTFSLYLLSFPIVWKFLHFIASDVTSHSASTVSSWPHDLSEWRHHRHHQTTCRSMLTTYNMPVSADDLSRRCRQRCRHAAERFYRAAWNADAV